MILISLSSPDMSTIISFRKIFVHFLRLIQYFFWKTKPERPNNFCWDNFRRISPLSWSVLIKWIFVISRSLHYYIFRDKTKAEDSLVCIPSSVWSWTLSAVTVISDSFVSDVIFCQINVALQTWHRVLILTMKTRTEKQVRPEEAAELKLLRRNKVKSFKTRSVLSPQSGPGSSCGSTYGT